MNVDEKMSLVREVGKEIITEEELKILFETKPHPIAYDGFEPSGKMHIAQGILRSINVNRMTKAGCRFKMFVADWHAWANNKMGGDLEKIQTVGKYMIEVWNACDMDLKDVEFVWGSDILKEDTYWKTVMSIARHSTLNRIIRCSQIMGRSESDSLQASQVFYPCMQAADIFELEADITQLGMDQRKVDMLAREIGPKLGFWKPVCVHHHMLMGLVEPKIKPEKKRYKITPKFEEINADIKLKLVSVKPGPVSYELSHNDASVKSEPSRVRIEVSYKGKSQFVMLDEGQLKPVDDIGIELIHVNSNENAEVDVHINKSGIERAIAMKMSKSIPDSAIFMTDTEDDIKRKISKAYCPEKVIEENPVIEYAQYLIFPKFAKLKLERPAKFGGDLEIKSFEELKSLYVAGRIHPMDLKAAVSKSINSMVEPVRTHFEKNRKAKALLEEVSSFGITR